jgi:hypothetical protein
MRTSGRAALVTVTAVFLLGVTSAPAASALGKVVVHSTSFAGYAAAAQSGIATFSGTITIPALTCPSTGSVDINSYVFLFNRSSTAGAVAQVLASCVNGSAIYRGAYAQVESSSSPTAVWAATSTSDVPGQQIRFTIAVHASSVTASVRNLTTGTSGSLNFPVTTSPSYTSITAGTAFSSSPIPSFTKVVFGALKFNGVSLAFLSPTTYDMYNGTTLQVAPGAFSTAGTFADIFSHV